MIDVPRGKVSMKFSIPTKTLPLTKAIRTSEGILVYAIDLILGLGAVIDPSQLPPSVAAKWAAVLAGLHVVMRTVLKITAVQKGVGIGDPIDPQPLIDKVAASVAAKTDAGPTVDEVRDLIEVAVARGLKAGGIPFPLVAPVPLTPPGT